MSSVVRQTCKSLGIRGEGASKHMTTHGLRGTMISLLIASGHSDASVVLRSGHADSSSLQSYHNLRGENGIHQLKAIFGRSRELNRKDTLGKRASPREPDNEKGVKSSSAQNDGMPAYEFRSSSIVQARNLENAEILGLRPKQNIGGETTASKDISAKITDGLNAIFGGSVNATNCNINVTITRN